MASTQRPSNRKPSDRSETTPDMNAELIPDDSDIEQQLDMKEDPRALRGDAVLRSHGHDPRREPDTRPDRDPIPLDRVAEDNFQPNMSEPDREGDEMSGDDHSSGLQGGDPDLAGQPHIDSGLPGEETEDESDLTERLNRRRAS